MVNLCTVDHYICFHHLKIFFLYGEPGELCRKLVMVLVYCIATVCLCLVPQEQIVHLRSESESMRHFPPLQSKVKCVNCASVSCVEGFSSALSSYGESFSIVACASPAPCWPSVAHDPNRTRARINNLFYPEWASLEYCDLFSQKQ